MKVKCYRDRYADIGDTIVTTYNPFGLGKWITEYEYKVIKLRHGYVVATSDRLSGEEVVIPDKYYEVVELVDENEIEKTNPVKSFLIDSLPIWFPILCSVVVILGLWSFE